MERVTADPGLLNRVRERVAEWRRTGAVADHYVDAWTEVLSLPMSELRARVLEPTEAGADLRQVSPFAGVLSARERWQLLRTAPGAGARASR